MLQPGAPEAVVAHLHAHARRMFWPTMLLFADAAAVGFFSSSPQPEWILTLLAGLDLARWERLLVPAAGTAVALFFFVLPLLRWLSLNYTITTRRIVVRMGLLVRSRHEVLHSRGYGVTLHQTGLQLLLRSGDVQVDTAHDQTITLIDVPNARLVQSVLNDLMEASRHPGAPDREHREPWST